MLGNSSASWLRSCAFFALLVKAQTPERKNEEQFIAFDGGRLITGPTGINSRGEITGYSSTSSNLNQGFLPTRDGTFITFDAPGAGTGPFGGTAPSSVNSAGEITGNYIDSSGILRGFLRKPDRHERSEDESGDKDDEDSEHPE